VKISACLITLQEERNLARCLRSVAGLVEEIVVVDSGSTDRTREMATEFGARVMEQAWLGYVGQKNFALEQAAHPWVLSIDADEEVSPELAAAILRVKSDPQADLPGAPNGYQVARLVFYRGRWIRHGDWYPDRSCRSLRAVCGALGAFGAGAGEAGGKVERAGACAGAVWEGVFA
jgi:glycosyltransferase involved in cell wall biosynthesis